MYIVINKDDEIWKELIAYNIVDKYEISNYGNIKNKYSGEIIENFICVDGYKRVNLRTTTSKKCVFLVHRLVAFTFVEGYDIESGKIIVNHLDSIRSHSYYENLEWVTYAENIRHGYEHGRILKYTERKVKDKLFDDDLVHEICRNLEAGCSPSETYKNLNTDQFSKKSIMDFIHRIKSTGVGIYNDIISQYKIPGIVPQIDLDDELVETICELLSKGYYTEDIISILNISKENYKKYQKNICDIKQRRTFTNISLKYTFPNHIYGRKLRYPLNATIEICEQLQNHNSVPNIIDNLMSKYNISDRIKFRDYIYDIKRRRIHTNISNYYKW